MATVDKQAKLAGKEVAFGVQQLLNPTPTFVRVIFRVILYLAAVWAIAAPVLTEIPETTLAMINKYLLLAVAIVNVTIKFFGYDFKN